jgi:hypothetical protein
MSPSLVDIATSPDVDVQPSVAKKPIFPDGMKTSGQHEPIYSALRAYEEFPKIITGRTIWKVEEYQKYPERWTWKLSTEEIDELSGAADAFISSGTPLTGISKVCQETEMFPLTFKTFTDRAKKACFPLQILIPALEKVRADLLDGKGFILLKGIPVKKWGNHKSAVAYMGLGTYLGYFVSQNSRGHVLGHVKDLGEDSTQTDKVRIYRTNAR